MKIIFDDFKVKIDIPMQLYFDTKQVTAVHL